MEERRFVRPSEGFAGACYWDSDDRLAASEHTLAGLVSRALPHHDTTSTVASLSVVREIRAQRDELAERYGFVVIAGSSLQQPRSAYAHRFYRGAVHRLALRAAVAMSAPTQVLILSARHGLVALCDVVSPYRQRIDEPDAVGDDELHRQTVARRLHGRRVVVLAGRAWAVKLARCVPVEAPLVGLADAAARRQLLEHAATTGQLPRRDLPRAA